MVSKKTYVLAIILVAIVVAASVYAIFMLGVQRETSPSETSSSETVPSEVSQNKTSMVLTDGTGRNVTVYLPIRRIVSLNSGLTEILYALGHGYKIVGRDANSVFPQQVLDKPVVGSSSYDPNVELLLELQPDLVVADDMLFYNQEKLSKIEEAGIPVIMENTSNVTRVKTVLANFGLVLKSESMAKEIVDFIEYYENLVSERVKDIPQSEKPLVYIEWYTAWQSFAKGSAGDKIIFYAGGVNIVAEINQPAPVLSPEFVVEKNPEIILRMAPAEAKDNLTAFMAVRDEILNRLELKETKAVKTGNVYVYDPIILEGIRYPVGLIYCAKWFHPELFADVNPDSVHAQLVQKYFNIELGDVYVYPQLTSNKTSQQEEESIPPTVDIIDATGASVTIKTPIKSIVSLNPGLTEIICALGCEDLIIGRDENSNFPKSILEKPVVGANSYRPNLELIIEKNPDILVADTMLASNKDALKTLQDAGITVIIELSNNSTRIKTFISYMGLATGKTARAKAIIDYMTYYENLVYNRVKGLNEMQKPRVYIEWHSKWRSFGHGSASHLNIISAGGINIGAEAKTSSPTLSPEYVVEKNPDVILVMVPAEFKGNLEGFVATRNEILNRAELSTTNAVKNGRVYVYDSVITQGIRYSVGLLYWAKWFNPTLFEDMDPGQVHSELINRFFGIPLEGVYVYP